MGGFDGFRGKFLFGEIREGRAGFNRAISLEVTRGGMFVAEVREIQRLPPIN